MSEVSDSLKAHFRMSGSNEVPMIQARSEGIINRPESDVLQAITDKTQIVKYNPMFENSEILEQFGIFQVVYIKNKGNFLATARDFVCISGRIRLDNTLFVFATSIDYAQKPPVPKIIRGHMEIRGWRLESLNKDTTNATMVAMIDPKGTMPSFAFKKASQGNGQTVSLIRDFLIKKK